MFLLVLVQQLVYIQWVRGARNTTFLPTYTCQRTNNGLSLLAFFLAKRYLLWKPITYLMFIWQVNAFRSMMHNDMMVGAFSHSTAVGKLRRELPDVPPDARVSFPRFTLDEAEAVCHYYLRYVPKAIKPAFLTFSKWSRNYMPNNSTAASLQPVLATHYHDRTCLVLESIYTVYKTPVITIWKYKLKSDFYRYPKAKRCINLLVSALMSTNFFVWQAKTSTPWSIHRRRLEEGILSIERQRSRDAVVSPVNAMTAVIYIQTHRHMVWIVGWCGLFAF